MGEDRLLTDDLPGLTRDSVVVGWRYKNKKIDLCDTAGLRKKSHITKKVERFSSKETLRSIRTVSYTHLTLPTKA